MIQLLDIMDRRFSINPTSISNGFETNAKILQYIEEHPDEVNTVDKNGYTPYHWILRYAIYPASLLNYILPYVKDPNIPRVTTVVKHLESPIVLLCQNTKRRQSMNTVLFVYKQLGKELVIGGKETGEFKTVCDRDEKIYPEPFVNSPFPLHEEPAALNNQPPVNRAALSKKPPVTSTRKQINVGFRPLHVDLGGTKPLFTNIVRRHNVPLSNQTMRSRRGAIVPSTFSPLLNSRNSRANSTNSANNTISGISNWRSLPPLEIRVPPVNTPLMPTIQLIKNNTTVRRTSNVQSVLSKNPPTTVKLNLGASASNNSVRGLTTPAVNPPLNASSNPAVSPNPYAGIGTTPPPEPEPKNLNTPPSAPMPISVVRTVVERTEVERKTEDNIDTLLGIVESLIKEFILTKISKQATAPIYERVGLMGRKLKTPATYTTKTSGEILDAFIDFVLLKLSNISTITSKYELIKESFSKLKFPDFVIARVIPTKTTILDFTKPAQEAAAAATALGKLTKDAAIVSLAVDAQEAAKKTATNIKTNKLQQAVEHLNEAAEAAATAAEKAAPYAAAKTAMDATNAAAMNAFNIAGIAENIFSIQTSIYLIIEKYIPSLRYGTDGQLQPPHIDILYKDILCNIINLFQDKNRKVLDYTTTDADLFNKRMVIIKIINPTWAKQHKLKNLIKQLEETQKLLRKRQTLTANEEKILEITKDNIKYTPQQAEEYYSILEIFKNKINKLINICANMTL